MVLDSCSIWKLKGDNVLVKLVLTSFFLQNDSFKSYPITETDAHYQNYKKELEISKCQKTNQWVLNFKN
jgi:hypothetical protein